MPIYLPPGLRRLCDKEFGQIAYDVLEVVFAVHNELGCLFVGHQKLNLISPDVSLCVSALNEGQERYEAQLLRFLSHTALKAIQWVNVGRKLVSFKTIKA